MYLSIYMYITKYWPCWTENMEKQWKPLVCLHLYCTKTACTCISLFQIVSESTITLWIPIDLPTHALLHFPVDETVGVVPLTRIIHPTVLELFEGCGCRVKWSGKKEYEATLLCTGKKFGLELSCLSLFSILCFFLLRWLGLCAKSGGWMDVGTWGSR